MQIKLSWKKRTEKIKLDHVVLLSLVKVRIQKNVNPNIF